MSNRPYFRYSGKELEDLFTQSKNNHDILIALKFELSHRKYTKSRLLEAKIEKLIISDSSRDKPHEEQLTPSSLYSTEATIIRVPKSKVIAPEPKIERPITPPERYIVECTQCKTPNFLYAPDDKVQYLSCSNCKTTFEVQCKQGVMRTTFHAKSETSSKINFSTTGWLLALVALATTLAFAIYLFM